MRDFFEHEGLNVQEVFERRCKWNNKIKNGKRHVTISWPADEAEPYIPYRIVFAGENREYGVNWPTKMVRCRKCNHHHRLNESHVKEAPAAQKKTEDNRKSGNEFRVVEGNSEENPEEISHQSETIEKEVTPPAENLETEDNGDNMSIGYESDKEQDPEKNEQPVIFERSNSVQDLEHFIDTEHDKITNKDKSKRKNKKWDDSPDIIEENMST